MTRGKMLGKYEKNCPYGCCSDYGHGRQPESRRRSRRQENQEFRKSWNGQIGRLDPHLDDELD